MFDPVDSFEHAGFTCEIRVEEESSMFNPRDDDNLGTMVCWHPDYVLGDLQFKSLDGRGAVRRDRHGSASTLLQSEGGRCEFRSMELVERYLRLAHKAVVVLPLTLYDHSGLSMRASSRPGPWDPGGWDSTMVGFIYTTAERIRELCGDPQIESDPFYCPRTWPEDGRSGPNWPADRTAAEWIAKQLGGEVGTYSQWLAGEVYYWLVRDAAGEVVESCGGYFRDDDGDGLEYLRSEAREVAESERAARADRAVLVRLGWALAHGLGAAF